MTLAPLTGTAWDALLDSYVEATVAGAHRASRTRTTARAHRAVEAVIDLARWTGATPETITYAVADRWLRRSGPRPRPEKLERRAITDVLDHAVACGQLDHNPMRALDDWTALLDGYEAAGLATESSVESFRRRTMRFARWAALPPCAVDEDLLVRYLANPDWKPEYRRSTRGALRMVFRHAYKAGFTTHDPAAELDSVRVPVGAPRPTPEAAISAALKGLPMRVRLMVLIAGLAGCRRAEIAVLRVEDITKDGLHITGKGGRERVVPIHPALGPELDAWLRISGITAGYIFPGETDGHLSPHRVGQLVSRALPGSWATHSLRHRFGSRAYAGAFDLRAVQELLGHSSPATTARYVAVPNTALVNAVAAVPPIPGMGAPPVLDDEDQGAEESA